MCCIGVFSESIPEFERAKGFRKTDQSANTVLELPGLTVVDSNYVKRQINEAAKRVLDGADPDALAHKHYTDYRNAGFSSDFFRRFGLSQDAPKELKDKAIERWKSTRAEEIVKRAAFIQKNGDNFDTAEPAPAPTPPASTPPASNPNPRRPSLWSSFHFGGFRPFARSMF